MKGDNKTVAAGLVGGDYPLWVGATTPTDAPYKVSIAGKLYAAGAVISGDSTFEGTLKCGLMVICIINVLRITGHYVSTLLTYGVEACLAQGKEALW